MPFACAGDPDAFELDDDEVLLLESTDELDDDEVLDDEAAFCLDDDELDEELLPTLVCASCWELDDEPAL